MGTRTKKTNGTSRKASRSQGSQAKKKKQSELQMQQLEQGVVFLGALNELLGIMKMYVGLEVRKSTAEVGTLEAREQLRQELMLEIRKAKQDELEELMARVETLVNASTFK